MFSIIIIQHIQEFWNQILRRFAMIKKTNIRPTTKNPLKEKLKAKRLRRFSNVRRHPVRQLLNSCK